MGNGQNKMPGALILPQVIRPGRWSDRCAVPCRDHVDPPPNNLGWTATYTRAMVQRRPLQRRCHISRVLKWIESACFWRGEAHSPRQLPWKCPPCGITGAAVPRCSGAQGIARGSASSTGFFLVRAPPGGGGGVGGWAGGGVGGWVGPRPLWVGLVGRLFRISYCPSRKSFQNPAVGGCPKAPPPPPGG